MECIEALFNNPLFSDSMQYNPFQVFKAAEWLVCIYGEWMSGNVAWNLQVSVGTGLAALSLPQGLSLPVVAYIIKLFLPFPFI